LGLATGGGNAEHGRTRYLPAAIRSTDGGTTWSGPTTIATQQVGSVSIQGQQLRTGDFLPEFAAGPEGNLYAP
jgi:hypothetical protein